MNYGYFHLMNITYIHTITPPPRDPLFEKLQRRAETGITLYSQPAYVLRYGKS